MYEYVHPNLAVVLLFVRTEVECGKVLLASLETLINFRLISLNLLLSQKMLFFLLVVNISSFLHLSVRIGILVGEKDMANIFLHCCIGS